MDSLPIALWVIATFIVAGLVKGVTGLGLPTVAMALLGTTMAPATAAALLLMPSLLTNLWQWLAAPSCSGLGRRLWPMLLAASVATLASTALLVRVEPRWSGLGLGLALVGYAGYALRVSVAPPAARSERWLAPLVGLVTGLITGATGVFVLPAVPYLQALRLDKDVLVKALGLSFTVSTVALALGLWIQDGLRVQQMGLSLLAIVPALAGLWLGQSLRARVGQQRFRQCLLLALLGLGLEQIVRALG